MRVFRNNNYSTITWKPSAGIHDIKQRLPGTIRVSIELITKRYRIMMDIIMNLRIHISIIVDYVELAIQLTAT